MILVGDASRTCGYQIALITTDLTSTPAQIVERYADRWPIEVAYEDAKHVFGVGHARNRTRKAVERTAPFQFLTMTLTVVWYALHGHHPDDVAQHRARAPWYLSKTKTNPSAADMLAKLRRTIIAAQYISIALLANRFDVMWVMSQVGHADSKMTTDVYAQLQQRVRRDHGRAFDALVRRAREHLHGAGSPSIRPRIGPRNAERGFPDPAADVARGTKTRD